VIKLCLQVGDASILRNGVNYLRLPMITCTYTREDLQRDEKASLLTRHVNSRLETSISVDVNQNQLYHQWN